MKVLEIPKDGLEGLKQNWKVDAVSGFLVFLLALPLSLGIAKASGFPAAMGVLTAMIGGMFVSIFAGSALTIKGPAAGLITICAGAVTELGALNIEGYTGVQLACGVIVVMAVIQIIFGFLKFGSLSDFFPPSAVHGMLAAIGLIIFSKQIHVLLGIDPATLKGLEPIELYEMIPHSFAHADPRVALVGVVSLIIIFGMPLLKGQFIKKIPAPMVVLVVTIPMAMIMDFRHTEPAFDLVSIGNFWENIAFNASFAAIGTGVFWKYVIMFLFINSLESLLTVKAIDGLDPYKRESNANKDLSALGAGNALSGLLGGLPMISEVARSSANVNFGGRTRWANFFHGLFLLIAMLLFIPVIEMIPNAALAALLIAVGYRLASPKEFYKTYKIGAEQLVIFVITVFVTVATDLLIGVASGIVIKFIFHILNGAPLRSLFKAQYEFSEGTEEYNISVKDSAIFSNLIGFKTMFKKIKPGKRVNINFSDARIVDHSFMEQLHHFEEEYQHNGGTVNVIGFEHFQPMSNHPLAARKLAPSNQNKIEIKLSPRQMELRKFAEAHDFAFYPQRARNLMKYKDFPLQRGNKLMFEENILSKYNELGKVEVSDISLQEGAMQDRTETRITVLQLSDTDVVIPDFALEPEGLWSKLFEGVAGKDIDFASHPLFSKKYYLRGENEEAITQFFSDAIIRFLENREEMHIESHKNRLIFYKKREVLEPSEIEYAEKFAADFLQVITQKK
ncbi:MAG: SulP family inorganic anion transporter [Bacteroidetes bacterium]|nr:SulP family inorganic anion transporter [Bacteroidota bacterium]